MWPDNREMTAAGVVLYGSDAVSERLLLLEALRVDMHEKGVLSMTAAGAAGAVLGLWRGKWVHASVRDSEEVEAMRPDT